MEGRGYLCTTPTLYIRPHLKCTNFVRFGTIWFFFYIFCFDVQTCHHLGGGGGYTFLKAWLGGRQHVLICVGAWVTGRQRHTGGMAGDEGTAQKQKEGKLPGTGHSERKQTSERPQHKLHNQSRTQQGKCVLEPCFLCQ